MNSHIVNCLEPRPEPPPATARPRADTSPHAHAPSGWGKAPLSIQNRRPSNRRCHAGTAERPRQRPNNRAPTVYRCGNVTAAPDPWMSVVSAGRKETAGRRAPGAWRGQPGRACSGLTWSRPGFGCQRGSSDCPSWESAVRLPGGRAADRALTATLGGARARGSVLARRSVRKPVLCMLLGPGLRRALTSVHLDKQWQAAGAAAGHDGGHGWPIAWRLRGGLRAGHDAGRDRCRACWLATGMYQNRGRA